MPHNKITIFEKGILDIGKNQQWLMIVVGFIFIFLVSILVYFTGGIKYVYSHTMYIPIVFISIVAGKKWGAFSGIMAGLLLGPFMPLDVSLGIKQEMINWIYRLTIFTFIGFFAGYICDLIRKNNINTIDLFSHNQETGIPNTNIFNSLSVKDNVNEKHNIVTILINNHDNIIDLLGIEIYHRLLTIIHRRLRYNISGEMIIVLADNNKIWIAKQYVESDRDLKYLLSILQEPLNIDDIPLYVEFSLGISTVVNFELCLEKNSYRESDMAARHAQKNNISYAIYSDDLLFKRSEFELLGIFSKALEDYQTKLVYQPKFDLKTNRPIGLEALIRWEHPKYGLIDPGTFIPLIEGTQLIHLLTEWVINQVVKKIIEFKCEEIDIIISVNVSAKNLFDPNFINQVFKALRHVSPKQIEIEITETVLMTNPEESKKILKEFVNKDIQIALDDFGRGYSSLAYLSQFPIKTVKLDQYFMAQLSTDKSVEHVVKATINLAHQLGYKVVAEGVETKEVLDIVKRLNCDIVQGFYFAKPIKDSEIIDWYKKNNER